MHGVQRWSWLVGWSGILLVSATGAARAEEVTVGECVQRALEHSGSVRAAALDARAAGGEAQAARAAYIPRLSVHGDYGRSEGFDEAVTNGGSTAAVIRLEATLLDGGLRDANYRAAKAKLRQAEALERQGKADLVFAVRSAYFTALAKETEFHIQSEAVGALYNYDSWLERQTRQGFAAPGDVERAALARLAGETSARVAAADRTKAEETLASLTGTAVPAAALVAPQSEPTIAGEPAKIDESPVVADAAAAVEAAEREAQAVRSERFGAIKIGAEAGALGIRPETTFAEDRGGQFLVEFNMPVFDPALWSRETAALARVGAARAKLDESRRTVALALSHADIEVRRADGDLAAARSAQPLAVRQFDLMRARHAGGGSVRLLEVLDALTQSVEARLNVSRALLARRLVVAARAQVLGDTTP